MGVIASMMAAIGDHRSIDNPALWDTGGNYGAATTSGELVTPDAGMQLSVYFRCISNIAEDVGKLPLILYRRLTPRGKERAAGEPVYDLLHRRPNPLQTAMEFREQVTGWAAGWGVGYAEIERNAAGDPVALWPIHPSRCEEMGEGSERVYRVHNDEGTVSAVVEANMIRITGLWNGTRSAIRTRAECLGVSIAAQKFAAAYYGNGMGISLAIVHPSKLSPEAHERMRASWATTHQGAGRAHKPFIGEEGVKLEKLSVPAEEAQFLETRQFQIEEICRWFRMPPHKVGHLERAAGWSTLESVNSDYIVDTLMTWFVRWEQELSRKLLDESRRGELFFEFLIAGLLRGDQEKRAAFYKSMFEIGAFNSNDIRELENLNPRDGGDTYFTPGNMMSDDQRTVATEAASNPPSVPQPPGAPIDNEDKEDEAEQSARAMLPVLADAAQRIFAKETKAVKHAASKHKGDAGAFNKWADEFYALHDAYLLAMVKPAVEAAARMPGGAADGNFGGGLDRWTVDHIEDSRNALDDAFALGTIDAICDQWLTTRTAATVERLAAILFPRGTK